MRIDVGRAIASWLLAAPLLALAWPLAEGASTWLGGGALLTLILARGAVGQVLLAARNLLPQDTRPEEPCPRERTS